MQGKINMFSLCCFVGVNDVGCDIHPPLPTHLSVYFAGCNSGDLYKFLKCHVDALPVPRGVELRSGAAGL